MSGEKTSQSGVHGGTPTDIAIWGAGDLTDESCSVSITAGSDTYAYVTNSFQNINLNMGTGNGAFNLYLDQMVISEYLFWSEGNVPTQAAVEEWVTAKYGIAWA